MEEEARPQNLQHLPREVSRINSQVHEIMDILDNGIIVGLPGMGGLGKKTIAMTIFNYWSSSFDYSCFVRDVKFITGGEDTVKDAVLDKMYCHGKKVDGRRNWSSLRGKKLLLVSDDISSREERLVFDLTKDPAAESRFILTSCDQELLRSLGEVYLVPLWSSDSAKVLFKKHAFPNLEMPPEELESVMEPIVKKCDGLPLTLEALGKFLRRKTNYEDWKQTLSALERAEVVKTLERLWAKLSISYDVLMPKEKQMFLDATTFLAKRSGLWEKPRQHGG